MVQGGDIPVQIGSPWFNQQSCCSYSVVPAPLTYKGSQALKFDLRRTDPVVSNRHRSEITQPGEPPGTLTRWYGAAFYLANNYEPDPQPEAIWQWHQESTSGSPPFAIWLRDGYLEVLRTMSTAIDGGWEVRPPYDSRYPRLKLNGQDVLAPVNQWFTLVINIKWTTNGTGYIHIWFNGQLAFSRTPGMALPQPQAQVPTAVDLGITDYAQGGGGGNYMKIGVYKWTFPNALDTITSRVMYVDEIRVGNANATYNDVAP